MKQKFLKYFSLGIVLTSVLFTSCRKDDFISEDDPQATLTTGKTFIKIAEGPVNNIYFTPFTEVRNVNLFTVRKDAANSADQATATSIQLTSAPDVITKYNTDNGEDYVALPESIYTLVTNSSIVKTATGYTFNFAPGEFAKELRILLDGSKYDLSKKYAVAFNVTNAGNATLTASTQKSILVLISIKNAYDGIYDVTGTLTDANGLYGGTYPAVFSLTTSAASSVRYYDFGEDYPNVLVKNLATGGLANTGISPIYTFDASGKLSSVVDANNAARVFTNVSGQFTASDRSIVIKWTAGRWTVNETWKFKEER